MSALASRLCQHCEGAGLELHAGGQVVCRYCGTVNVLDGVVCPHCEHVRPLGAEHCANCRQALARPCPSCGTRNWIGAETCRKCAASLDPVTLLSNRFGGDPAQRFNEQQRSSRAIKQAAELGSQRRLAELNDMETRRQAGLRAAQEKKAAEHRLLLIGAAVVVLVIVVVVAVSVLLTSLR